MKMYIKNIVFAFVLVGLWSCKAEKTTSVGVMCDCYTELKVLREKVKAVGGDFVKIGLKPEDGKIAIDKFNDCMNKAIVKYNLVDDKGNYDKKFLAELEKGCPELFSTIRVDK